MKNDFKENQERYKLAFTKKDKVFLTNSVDVCLSIEHKGDKLILPRECPLLMMSNLYHTPGSGNLLINEYKNQPEISLFLKAQLTYFQGDFEKAYIQVKSLLPLSTCFDIRVGIGMLLVLCANARGDIILWEEAKQYIASTSCQNQQERYRLAFWLAAIDSTIDDNTTFPKWFQHGNFDLLPKDAFPLAHFFYIKFLFLTSKELLDDSIDKHLQHKISTKIISAVCEPLISQAKVEQAILPEIYLRLLCAMAYYSDGNENMAIVHLDIAIELALPDQLFSPFAEARQSFGYLMDDRINRADRNALLKVRKLNKKMLSGWISIHNKKLGRTKSSELTIRELEVARLAIYGYTNVEIAEQLNISLNTVKFALKNAMSKTNCKNRHELIKYL